MEFLDDRYKGKHRRALTSLYLSKLTPPLFFSFRFLDFVFWFFWRDGWTENFWYDLIYLKDSFVEWKDLSDWKGDNSFRYKIRELSHGILRCIRSLAQLVFLISGIMFTFTLFSIYSSILFKVWGGNN